MKKIFLTIIGMLLTTCSPKIVMGDGVVIDNMGGKISMAQFDSVCVADTLPRRLSDWEFLELRRYKNTRRASLFSYTKKDGTIYKVLETMDDSVIMRKKKIKMYE